jgi:hypothetical protein
LDNNNRFFTRELTCSDWVGNLQPHRYTCNHMGEYPVIPSLPSQAPMQPHGESLTHITVTTCKGKRSNTDKHTRNVTLCVQFIAYQNMDTSSSTSCSKAYTAFSFLTNCIYMIICTLPIMLQYKNLYTYREIIILHV